MSSQDQLRDLLDRLEKGDAEAGAEIIGQQRAGRALRLYPHGRKGPDDEGLSVVLMTAEFCGLVKLSLGHRSSFVLARDQIAEFTLNLIRVCLHILLNGDGFDRRDKPSEFEVARVPGKNELELWFGPESNRDFLLDLSDCQSLVGLIVAHIEQLGWDDADCGFTDEQYEVALFFQDP